MLIKNISQISQICFVFVQIWNPTIFLLKSLNGSTVPENSTHLGGTLSQMSVDAG